MYPNLNDLICAQLLASLAREWSREAQEQPPRAAPARRRGSGLVRRVVARVASGVRQRLGEALIQLGTRLITTNGPAC